MMQAGRNAQGIQLIDKAAAACANRRADLMILFENQRRAPAARQRFRGGEPRRAAPRNNRVVTRRSITHNLPVMLIFHPIGTGCETLLHALPAKTPGSLR